jgi:hypothetical protein
MSTAVFQVKKRTLHFHVEAGTSRGILTQKNSYFNRQQKNILALSFFIMFFAE